MSRPYYLREPGWMPLYKVGIRSLVLISAKMAIWWAFRNVRGFPFIVVHAATWVIWLVIGGFPIAGCLCGGGSKLRRYSISGFSRPRWWFEVARVFVVIFFLSFLSMPLFLFAPAGKIQIFLEVGTALSRSCDVAFISYLATFIIGCMLSSARRLPKSGRAFDCGRWVFWFAPVTSMYLIGVRLWPPGAFWPGGALFWTFATIGVVSYVVAIRSVGKQLNRYRKSQEKQRKAAQKSQSRLQRPASESR